MYYSGSVNSYADLRTALFTACTSHGWTLSTDVLTKGTLSIKATVNLVSSSTLGIGIILQGGTGATGSTLTDPSPNKPRLGPASINTDLPTFPFTYEIFIFENPDEVYLVAKTNVDQHLWLAFGESTYTDIGLWISAVCNTREGPTGNGIYVDSTGDGAGFGQYSSGCLFWTGQQYDAAGAEVQNQDTAHVDMDGMIWAGNPTSASVRAPGSFSAIQQCTNLLAVQPNAWNSDAVLIRIKPIFWRASNKNSVIADLQNARYVRVDNYESGQIVPIGPDNWKVFPFYRKNTTDRNGGGSVNHTGTFGWAIRYDGPV